VRASCRPSIDWTGWVRPLLAPPRLGAGSAELPALARLAGVVCRQALGAGVDAGGGAILLRHPCPEPAGMLHTKS
jgi:hypothetical protein